MTPVAGRVWCPADSASGGVPPEGKPLLRCAEFALEFEAIHVHPDGAVYQLRDGRQVLWPRVGALFENFGEGGDGPIRGEAIGGITWHDTLPNPFTGDDGVLLGTDVGSDELVYIDHRPRFPTADIFSLHVAQASGEVMVAIAEVKSVLPEADPHFEPTPGEGAA